MAIEIGRKTRNSTISERTWRTEIESPVGGIPTVTAHREQIEMDGDEVVSQKAGIQVRRSLADLQKSKDEVKIGGLTITAVQMATFIPAFIDKWRQEDIAAEAAAAQAQAAANARPE